MGPEELSSTSIIVDLDCIVDTRLPVLYGIHKQTAMNVVEDERYHKRIRDVFGNISLKIFNVYYKKRTKEVLKLATPTPLTGLLSQYCMEAYKVAIDNRCAVHPKLYINTYPYAFNDSESELLLNLFSGLLTVPMDIDLIFMDNHELTPKFVYSNSSMVIKYDMISWLEYHSAIGNLVSGSLMSVTCVGPLISNGRKPTKNLTQGDFDTVRSTFGPFTSLVLLQSRMFSAA